MPDDARCAGLTLIGWLARRMPGEEASRDGVDHARQQIEEKIGDCFGARKSAPVRRSRTFVETTRVTSVRIRVGKPETRETDAELAASADDPGISRPSV